MTQRAILHVCDWNCQDRYYETTEAVLAELKARVLTGPDEDPQAAWEWFTDNKDSKYVQDCVNLTLETYFFDYAFAPHASVSEWEDLED